jgi:hypothetical protein
MTAIIPIVPTRAHLDKFFERVDPAHARICFCVDATASRQPTWDTAAQITAAMFETASGLNVQLVYYRGYNECVASRWLSDSNALRAAMERVTCAAGYTQLQKVLAHTRKEHIRERVDALIVIPDACEEIPADLYQEARELGARCFMFQEATDPHVTAIYAEIARLTGGAHCTFDSNAAQRLADLLKAVAAFATGGLKALADQKSDAARLLLTQIKK